ncbi:MAG TPA: hypothetical protein ENN54_00990 [Thermoplasmatales archaeon]|nr:hypothetical protein [Thermoplasmatales archaeon]
MKRIIVTCLVVGMIGIAGNVMAAGDGPAPNSGDGNPDGSGLHPIEPNGEGVFGDGYGEPAPSSGDGISDGSGR